jgi:hypothetical protein
VALWRRSPLRFAMDGAAEKSTMDFKGSQFERAIILWGVRWHVAYPLSYRQLQGIRGARGVVVVHFMVIGARAPRSPRITCLYSAPDSIINVSSAIITTRHM